MAVPKRKVSNSKRNMRRAHNALQIPALSEDPETGELHRRHHVTESGFYRGHRVLPEKPVLEEEEA